ncbi:MAG: acetate/propionate family kinase [Geminicoccaceae bacterium]
MIMAASPEATITNPQPVRILTINGGSSSLKFALYHMGEPDTLLWSGRMEGIGLEAGRFHVKDARGAVLIDQQLALPDHESASRRFLDWLRQCENGRGLDAVGHRVVHGGIHYTRSQPITPEMEAELETLGRLDPEHLPHELKVIRAMRQAYPDLLQVACFDTAFHRQMPKVAQMLPLPRALFDEGIVRFGFHGLSYEFLIQELARVAGAAAARGRVVIAHLGNGASMAAIRDSHSIDTTMGFMPSGGLMMSTRSGDLDPGVLLHLLQQRGLSPTDVNAMVNHGAGLLGVSGIAADMQQLLVEEATSPHAAEAIALFCYSAKKFLGALAAVLGGLDTLIFTAGIGENSPAVRERVCANMEFLGIQLDPLRNQQNAAIISPDHGRVSVRVMKTNEELMIAKAVHRIWCDRDRGGRPAGELQGER